MSNTRGKVAVFNKSEPNRRRETGAIVSASKGCSLVLFAWCLCAPAPLQQGLLPSCRLRKQTLELSPSCATAALPIVRKVQRCLRAIANFPCLQPIFTPGLPAMRSLSAFLAVSLLALLLQPRFSTASKLGVKCQGECMDTGAEAGRLQCLSLTRSLMAGCMWIGNLPCATSWSRGIGLGWLG